MTKRRSAPPLRSVLNIHLLAALALLLPLLTLAGASPAEAVGAPQASVFVSSTSGGTVPGPNGPISFGPEDVLMWDAAADQWSMIFDGSDLGVANVDGLLIESINGTVDMLLSFAAPQTIPDVGPIDDSDIVRFSGSYADGNTAGTFEMVLDGSAVGLSSGGEDVDAIAASAGSDLVLSTMGGASVPKSGGGNLSASDEDVIGLSNGAFSMLFDGSDAGVISEDVNSAHLDTTTGVLYGSMENNFSAGTVSGDRNDVWSFTGTTGPDTSGVFGKIFDGDLHNFGSETIDALFVSFESPPPAGSSDLAVTIADLADPVDGGDQLAYEVEVANSGPDAAANVAVALTLPTGVSFDRTSGCAESGSTCSLGTISANDSKVFTLFVDVDQNTSGTITTAATVSSSNTDPVSADNTASEDTVVEVAPTTGGDLIYLSSNISGKAGRGINSISYRDEDVVVYDVDAGTWAMHFDGSDLGLANADIDGIYVTDTGIDFSLTGPFTIPGLGRVDDSDIVRFTGTTGSTTSGSLQLVVDGTDVALTSGGEDVDAVTMKDGVYVVSTLGAFNAGGTVGADEDALHLANPTALLFDGSDADLKAEDLVAVHYDHGSGTIYGASQNGFRVSGLIGDRNDIFAFTGTTGDVTSGTYSLYLDGAAVGFSGQVDAVHIGSSDTEPEQNEAPVITTFGGSAVADDTIVEGAGLVENLEATDDRDSEGSGLVYSISGGADASNFFVDPVDGVITTAYVLDFENPTDVDGDGVYEVEVTVTDSGGLSDSVAISVAVADIDADLSITIDNGQFEIGTDPTTYTIVVTNNGPDGAGGTTISWALDAGLQFLSFDDLSSGCVLDTASNSSCSFRSNTFIQSGATEMVEVTAIPAADLGPVVTTTASATTRTDDLANPDNNTDADTDTRAEAPVITSFGGSAVAVDTIKEGAMLVENLEATDDRDSEGSGLVYSISGGADASNFFVNPVDGAMTTRDLDFENPTDANGDGVYEVEVTVTDSGGLIDSVAISVTVADVDADLSITIDNSQSEIETDPTTYRIVITNDGPDEASGPSISWALDAGLQFVSFNGFSTGCVLDTATNSSCSFPVAAGLRSGQTRIVDVTAVPTVDIGPVVMTTASVASPTDDLLDPNNNADADTDTGPEANEAPVITSYGGAPVGSETVRESATRVTVLHATDDHDSEGAGLTFSVTGGEDRDLFAIAGSPGGVVAVAPLDFENPTDADGNGIYEVEVTVTDSGGRTDMVGLFISVIDLEADLSVIIDNNQTKITTDPTTYTIVARNDGPDLVPQATISWQLDPGLVFTSFDDKGTGCVLDTATNASCTLPIVNNGFAVGTTRQVDVTATPVSIGETVTTTATVASNIDDLVNPNNNTDSDVDDGASANGAPTITSYGGADAANDTVAEGLSLVENIEASDDSDSEGSGLAYSITGADAALFDISPNSGVLFVAGGLDFENPTDANGDGIYEVRVTVTDSAGLADAVAISITVLDEDADLAVEIVNDRDVVQTGSTTYTITVINNGPSSAFGTRISWGLDEALSFTSFDPGTSGCLLDTATESFCVLPAFIELEAGGTLEISVTVDTASLASDVVTTAAVTSETDDLVDPDNNRASDTDIAEPL